MSIPVESDEPSNAVRQSTFFNTIDRNANEIEVLQKSGTDYATTIAALTARVASMQGTFIVATTVPFTVKLDGSAVAVPGLKHVGSSYVVGTAGRYTRDTGSGTASVVKPLCFPTA